MVSSAQEQLETYNCSSSSWMETYLKTFGTDNEIAYFIDNICYKFELEYVSQTVLIIQESELDATLGSPMKLKDNGVEKVGIQFRNGFGAVLREESQSTALEFPLYSPFHRDIEDIKLEKLWILI